MRCIDAVGRPDIGSTSSSKRASASLQDWVKRRTSRPRAAAPTPVGTNCECMPPIVRPGSDRSQLRVPNDTSSRVTLAGGSRFEPSSPGRERVIPSCEGESGKDHGDDKSVPNNQGSGRIKRPEP